MKKLPGFTILETLLTVLLTSIILSLSFLYFNSFQKYLHLNSKNLEYETSILRFESLLNYDLDRCVYVLLDADKEIALTIENEEIIYSLTDRYFVRKGNKSFDTLNINSGNLSVNYYPNTDLITGIKIEFDDINNTKRLYYSIKKYSEKDIFMDYMRR
ncbi:MAG: hypothetical protein JXA77_00445 [Bacteroidales bacterium]|nr:hypothetical protein [Bacteroidales bacterium]MBN2817642.1 hypothetical protein [Bacteroidales bacterium]